MAEEHIPVIQEIAGITVADVQAFLEERSATANCGVCMSNIWKIVHEQHTVLAYIGLPTDGSFRAPPPAMPVALAVCIHCGFARPHVLGVILEWKLAKSAAK